MLSNAISSIYNILRKTRLYHLNTNGLTDAELSAYDAGFLIIEKYLQKIENYIFLQTTDEEGISHYENLCAFVSDKKQSLEHRRSMLQAYLSITPKSFSTEEIEKALLACGIKGNIKFHSRNKILTIFVTEFIDPELFMEKIHQRLERILPVELDYQLQYGTILFDHLDDTDKSWDQWESMSQTWNIFDKQ